MFFVAAVRRCDISLRSSGESGNADAEVLKEKVRERPLNQAGALIVTATCAAALQKKRVSETRDRNQGPNNWLTLTLS